MRNFLILLFCLYSVSSYAITRKSLSRTYTKDVISSSIICQPATFTFAYNGKMVSYRAAVVSIEGVTMTLNGAAYIGLPNAPSGLEPCVGVFTRKNN